jgi:hypothetical protein
MNGSVSLGQIWGKSRRFTRFFATNPIFKPLTVNNLGLEDFHGMEENFSSLDPPEFGDCA